MKYLFDIAQEESGEDSQCEECSISEPFDHKENLYVSKKVFSKISRCLERIPEAVRHSEVCEDGWFNKKESYIRKRLKHKRKEGKYCLGISNLYRSFNGKRISRYQLYWLYERDVYYINKGLALKSADKVIPTDIVSRMFSIINIDLEE